MPTLDVYSQDGTKTGEIELSEVVFAAPVNENVLHEIVVAHLANRRQGTQSALTRAEVRGGGIKPFRQKGTGRARQGSSRSPQYEGGGVVFAPKPRDYSKKMNKKARRAAMRSALSSKVADGDLIVLDGFTIEEPKTKQMIKILGNVSDPNASTLIVTGTVVKDEATGRERVEPAPNVVKSASNLPNVRTAVASALSVYDILNHDKLIVSQDAVDLIEKLFGDRQDDSAAGKANEEVSD